jgi:hypothetical protein
MSNKRNMRGYENPAAARFNTAGRTWFYWWLTRLLLERVTDFCERRALRDYGEPRIVRLEFSRRKGLRYAHFRSYLYWLRTQSKANALFINRGDLRWSVIDPINQVHAFDHSERAGLQLSDVVAGAFFQSVNGAPIIRSDYAMALEPRMARDVGGKIFGYSLKLMPSSYLWRAPSSQHLIFDFYRKR